MTLAVPGGDVFVRQWHPSACRSTVPLVLLHDSLGSVELWRDFPVALATRLGRPVIAYDRLGYGRSSPRRDVPSPDFIQDEAHRFFPAIRQQLGIESYALFGHSVGGTMALTIAAADPERVRQVVSESAQAFVELRTVAGIRAAEERFQRPEEFARLTRWHGENARWVLEAWTRVWLAPQFQAWSLDPVLPAVRCPVLALHGDADEFGSVAFPTRIVQGVSGPAQLAVLPGCGHVPHREQAETVLGLVAAFLAA